MEGEVVCRTLPNMAYTVTNFLFSLPPLLLSVGLPVKHQSSCWTKQREHPDDEIYRNRHQ
jgi:hypothetical protein